jgi:membrane protein implicated in regulation of membrane protease activity
MLKEGLIALLVGFVVYEVVEHLVLPLIWMMRHRERQPACGPAGMIGRKCVVKEWSGARGKVRYGAELWDAVSQSPQIPGSEAVIEDVQGLTLSVSSSNRPP